MNGLFHTAQQAHNFEPIHQSRMNEVPQLFIHCLIAGRHLLHVGHPMLASVLQLRRDTVVDADIEIFNFGIELRAIKVADVVLQFSHAAEGSERYMLVIVGGLESKTRVASLIGGDEEIGKGLVHEPDDTVVLFDKQHRVEMFEDQESNTSFRDMRVSTAWQEVDEGSDVERFLGDEEYTEYRGHQLQKVLVSVGREGPVEDAVIE
jgi:hypothetical protein